ncbi:DUF6122 family protein [Bizionia paragorgiae]|uniref:LexA-binding, inner membrane-associated hydrolase n=1 Tax=Bizionia paragorgiae TaxID=283786 RepID=A0A1H4CZP7_BIZPA|nr:DUF6122 family protein [Bizionia paragorgiae]SEA65837.1 hypothetical protein SAMN04487990_12321 [Bizionia paragorgiae]
MLTDLIHYGIHIGGPLLVAVLFYRTIWMKAFGIMLLGMLIDLDHFLATPLFDPTRCSINFHPLHSYYAIAIYVLLLFPKKTRLIALGLVIHIIADSVNCLMM